jgi:hypothetical protein
MQNTSARPTSTTAAQEAWLEIARRNYLDVAHLWWDDFKSRPSAWSIPKARHDMTPLQFAARSGHMEMVEFLL